MSKCHIVGNHMSPLKYKSTYKNQSTTRISVMSSTGSPTADSTITMVTRPACGTPAAPIEAAVAVMLKKTCHVYDYREYKTSIFRNC